MKYFYQGQFNPEKLPIQNIDRQTVSLVPEGSRVLEIGCADGFMGEYLLKKKQCQVLGVEIDKEAGQKARQRGLQVVTGDIEENSVISKIKTKNKFEVILASSVIEHLKDPQKALWQWRNFLKDDGYLIITTPNVAHWSSRLKIFLGKFPCEEYGIFDKNHLHFFTIETFKKLIEDCGFWVEHLGIDPTSGGLPKFSRFLSKFFPGLSAYQIVIRAKLCH